MTFKLDLVNGVKAGPWFVHSDITGGIISLEIIHFNETVLSLFITIMEFKQNKPRHI